MQEDSNHSRTYAEQADSVRVSHIVSAFVEADTLAAPKNRLRVLVDPVK